ncbi:N-acetylmannosamine-6-phosphate 2-epimerase [candidate division NPL-UPA2 bacterium]|nr:N-acetylmannosamine-6-phosphate 2-epimerase [candidate division NPL-UPA2 bacterium]
MKREKILKKIEEGIIVSCQAEPGTPLYGYMHLMAKAAKMGGAKGVRVNGKKDILMVKKYVKIPVIGIYKKKMTGTDVIITPDFQSAKQIIDTGVEILALDATFRKRKKEPLAELVQKIRKYKNDIILMADISIYKEGLNAEKLGFDLVATTLSGYTDYSPRIEEPDFKLIKELSKKLSIPVIAEGRIRSPADARKAFKSGAFSLVVGTAITRPHLITKRFVIGSRVRS